MSVISGIVLGAIGVSVIWMFAIAWLLDVIAVQRKTLSSTQTTLRLYRETRTDSDATIRDLSSQNTRLARQLIERAADSTAAPVVRVPPTWFSEARES